MNRKWIVPAATSGALLVGAAIIAAPADASIQGAPTTSAFLKVVGSKQGAFPGESLVAKRKGWSDIDGFSYKSKNHSQVQDAFIVTKLVDGATPRLLQAANTGEVLLSVTVATESTGPSTVVTLNNVTLVSDSIDGARERLEFKYPALNAKFYSHDQRGANVLRGETTLSQYR